MKKRSGINGFINNKKYDKGKKLEDEVKKNRIDTQEIVKRLYYLQTRKKYGINDIRKNLKLTEYVVLHFAKQKLHLNKINQIFNPYECKI